MSVQWRGGNYAIDNGLREARYENSYSDIGLV
jgi:hypothetical protein